MSSPAEELLAARVAQLEQLCEAFISVVRHACPILRNVETVLEHEAEGMRALEIPSAAGALECAHKDLQRIRRALSHEADRLLTDTQPIDVSRHDEPS